MSGMILIKSGAVNNAAVQLAKGKFKKKSFNLKEEKFILGEHELYYYHDLFGNNTKVYKNAKGDSFLVVGTLVFERTTGICALQNIENRLELGHELESMTFSGTYILIIYRNGNLFISRDLFGGIDCYLNTSKDWITTNFLSAMALNGENRFSKNELLESILYDFVFGYQTIITGIFLLETTNVFNLTLNSSIRKTFKTPQLEKNLTQCLQNNLDILVAEFEGFTDVFKGNIVSALSGGFDSRLMLALMIETGVAPNLYVYGSNSDQDVKIAKLISENEGFSLLHVNKRNYPTISLDEFINVVAQNYYDLDSQSNVFSDQSDVDTRMIRSGHCGLVLNGSGGEIYRDVWKWDFNMRSLNDILRNLYDIGFLDSILGNTTEFFSNIETKTRKKASLFHKLGEDKITRQEAEIIYPIFMSKFYSPSNTLNNYFGNATFPFLSESVLLQSFSIPHRFKRYGEFERLLIKKLNPKLASYTSNYGFNFETGPGLRDKAQERFYSMLSPRIKAKLKSIPRLNNKSLLSKFNIENPYLENEYLSQLIDPFKMRLGIYVNNIHKIKNQRILTRIYNFEYLARRNDIS